MGSRSYKWCMEAGCNCKSCQLAGDIEGADNDDYGGPVPDDGGDYTILAVGEAPGADENRLGIPFVGDSGQRLREALKQLGYPMDKVTFTNLVKCRPPDNKLKATHIKCCYTGLPIKDNTKLVLLLGNNPMKAVIGETGITQWNGIVVERDDIIYAPVYHPAYTLHNQSDDVMSDWLDALDNALTMFSTGMEQPADANIKYMYPVTDTEIATMCAHIRHADMLAFDTEVAGLDPFDSDNRILAMSFSDGKRAWAVPVDMTEPIISNKPMVSSYQTRDVIGHTGVECASDIALEAIIDVLEKHPCVIGHNIKFDQMMVDHMLGCKFEAGGDTMLMSFLADSRKGNHGLKRLAGYYLGMFEYDKELTDYTKEHKECDYRRGGSYANIPPDILLPYAARDAAATWLLYDVIQGKLTDKQLILLDQLTIPVSNALYRMQLNGISVDADVADRYRRLYGQVSHDLTNAIQDDGCVQAYVTEQYTKYLTEHPKGRKTRERFTFNPGSSVQKAYVLYNKRPSGHGLKVLGKTETGKPSTKREYLEPYRKTVPLVDHMIMYNMLDKMLGTYILPVATGAKLSGDGRARSSFNLHIVETGRLSSSSVSSTLGFNQQNIPTPEKEAGTILEYQPIKNMFTHTWDGGCIMSVDYSGMELRVFASLAECWPMIDIHASGKDFHTMVASMVSGLPESAITKPMRYRYKWTNWTILFMGNAHTLHKLYGIPLAEGEETIRKYFDMFPEVPVFQRECIDFTREHGYIETPFGNRRSLPDIRSSEDSRRSHAEPAAANTPVQGAAGMLTTMALAIMDYMMDALKLKSIMVNTVHDSIVTDVYPGELERTASLQADIMENVVEYATWLMPDIDMDWLICPLKVDIEAGSHYGVMGHVALPEDARDWAKNVRLDAIGGKYD